MDDLVETLLDADVHEIRRRDGGPMRDLLRLHPTMEVRMYPSWKTRRPIYTAGDLELLWRRVFEVDPTVVAYASQLFTLVFPLDARIVSYIPDFEVLRTAPAEVVEAKPKRALARDRSLQLKLAHAKHILKCRGIRLRILGYEALPDADWLAAAEDIADLGRTELEPLDAHRVTCFLRERGVTTLGRAASVVQMHPEPIRGVLSLALRPRAIVVDMRGPVTSDTRVRLRADGRG